MKNYYGDTPSFFIRVIVAVVIWLSVFIPVAYMLIKLKPGG
jgi:hypothetical protein